MLIIAIIKEIENSPLIIFLLRCLFIMFEKGWINPVDIQLIKAPGYSNNLISFNLSIISIMDSI